MAFPRLDVWSGPGSAMGLIRRETLGAVRTDGCELGDGLYPRCPDYIDVYRVNRSRGGGRRWHGVSKLVPDGGQITCLGDVQVHLICHTIHHHPQRVVVLPLGKERVAPRDGQHCISVSCNDRQAHLGYEQSSSVVLLIECPDEQVVLAQVAEVVGQLARPESELNSELLLDEQVQPEGAGHPIVARYQKIVAYDDVYPGSSTRGRHLWEGQQHQHAGGVNICAGELWAYREN